MTDPTNTPARTSRETTGGVIRIATFVAKEGRMADLVEAAHGNATTALTQEGCLSAEVATVPDDAARAIVISRWTSPEALAAYLEWHQGIAHSSMADSTVATPTAVHYPLV